MGILLDSSVLVASMVEGHPHHVHSFRCIQDFLRQKSSLFVASHSLAECYSTLTRSSLPYAVTPEEAEVLIGRDILGRFRVIESSIDDYRKTIQKMRELGLRNGAIYDALIFQMALKVKAKRLVTWNLKHFARFSGDGLQVQSPEVSTQ